MNSTQVRSRLADDVARLAEELQVPGVAVALAFDDQVVEVQHGVINNRTGVAMSADTVSMLQSVTKMFTATLVMQLVDDELVDLDSPVRRYLPGFRTADEPRSNTITVGHLLTHTGGFEGDLWQVTTSGPDALERFVDDLVPGARQNSQPGRLWSYCNAGFGVLGRLVEVLRGSTFEEALRHHLAEPLGIEEIAFFADQALAFRTAIGHVRPTASAPLQPMTVWSPNPRSNPAAGNQLSMSARGLLAFARMHLADGVAPDGTRLLSTESARSMRRPRFEQPQRRPRPTEQGLGWMVDPGGVVQHGGGSFGVASILELVPERGVAVGVLTNAEAGGELIRRLLDPLLADLADVSPAPKLPTPDRSAATTTQRAELDRLAEAVVGRYETRSQVHEVTREDDGALMLTNTVRNELAEMARLAGTEIVPERRELWALDDQTFLIMDDDGQPLRAIDFLGRDGDGRAEYLHTGRAAPRIA